MMNAHLLTDTINVASVTGSDFSGETYGTPVAVKVKIELAHGRSVAPDGTTRERNDKFISLTEIKVDDKIWFPGQSTSDDTLARIPASVKEARRISNNVQLWEVEI